MTLNVTRNTCKYPSCDKRASYNFRGERVMFCKFHKKDGMINLTCKICEHPECDIIASFSLKDEKKRRFCATHKEVGMVNKKEVLKRCLTTLCTRYIHSKKYEGYCTNCFSRFFPDKSCQIKNFKTKEISVLNFVKENFGDLDILSDQRIPNGISKRRPDIFIDLGFQVIIIEVDENQHFLYNKISENQRIFEISRDVGYRPIIMIRFNPDGFSYPCKETNKNVIVPSCWKTNTNRVLQLSIKNFSFDRLHRFSWEQRLITLKENINYWIKHKTNKPIEILFLFYSES